tara:strand:+ start:374 stop:1540 length:1167 start_codon:yes stop_codon:yes gene_type:complete
VAKKKKLNGFQKKQQKGQKYKGTDQTRFTNLIKDLNKTLNLHEVFNHDWYQKFKRENVGKSSLPIAMNNNLVTLILELETNDLQRMPLFKIDSKEYQENGYPTPIITLDTIFTGQQAPKGYGSIVLKEFQRLCGLYNFDIHLIANDIQRNPNYHCELRDQYEGYMKEMTPIMGDKVKKSFDRWDFYYQEFRQYTKEEPKYTGTETRSHLWNFYKSHGFIPNVWIHTKQEERTTTNYNRKLLWFNPNSKNTDLLEGLYPSVVGENKLFTYDQSLEFLMWVYDHDRIDLLFKNEDQSKVARMIFQEYADDINQFTRNPLSKLIRYDEIYKDIIETNDPIIHQSQSLSSCERINEDGVLKEMARILHFDKEQEYSTSIQGGDVTDIRQISL